MKRIKCESCLGVWMIEDIDLNRQRVCPYCSVSIKEKIDFLEYDSLDKAIYGAILKMGRDILQKPKQLSGFMMDTAPSLKKEIRIFSKTVSEDYIENIKDAFEQEVDAAEIAINKLHHLFVEEEGLSDSWADVLCTGLYGAILFVNGVGTTRMIKVEVDDFIVSSVKKASTKKTSASKARDRYDVNKHYRCALCGFEMDGFNLKYGYGDDTKRTACGAECWIVTW